MARKKKPGVDPTDAADPRYTPADDAANARAHKRDQRAVGSLDATVKVKRKRISSGENPASDPDPRFDPETDEQNETAHDVGSGGADDEGADEDTQAIVRRLLEQAVSHYQENLEPEQSKATDYYKGRPFGDEKDGRSKVVSTDVRDATLAQMPSIMRVVFGPDQTVEFKPRGPEDEAMARQMTDGVRYVITEENEGFILLHDGIQDGLVRKLGVWKAWSEENYRVTATRYTGLSQDAVAEFEGDSECEVEIVGRDPGAGTYEVRVKRRKKGRCTKVAAVPPEEWVYTPGARSIDSAPLVAHVREVPADELIALGIDPDLVKENIGKTSAVKSDDLFSTRQFYEGATKPDDSELDDSQRTVLYAEAYVLVDGDGDDIAERRLFQCVGPNYEIANGEGEIVDEVPFACWSPYREAHTIVGDGNYDLLKDVQRIKSQMQRLMLDSFSLAVNNKQEVVQGQVNMADLLNDEIGGFVRVRSPGQIREIGHTFVGESALPVLGYFDGIKEDRTGTSKAAMGLDADALQSSTKAAVAATLSGSQQRIEFIVRMLAETGLKRLFKLVAHLETKHQNEPRMMRLRNQWVPVDPHFWDAGLDVQVNVALGQGTSDDKINWLSRMLETQMQGMQAGLPFIKPHNIRRTLDRLTEQAGYKDSSEFFEPWGPEQDQAVEQAQAQNQPPPDPTMLLAQIEQSKVQLQAMEAERKAQLEQWKAVRADDLERDKLAADITLRREEMALKYHAEMNQQQIDAEIERERAALDAETKATAGAEAA